MISLEKERYRLPKYSCAVSNLASYYKLENCKSLPQPISLDKKQVNKNPNNIRINKKAKSVSRKENKTQVMSRFKIWACDYIAKVESAFNVPFSTSTPMARNRAWKRDTMKSMDGPIGVLELKKTSIPFKNSIIVYHI